MIPVVNVCRGDCNAFVRNKPREPLRSFHLHQRLALPRGRGLPEAACPRAPIPIAPGGPSQGLCTASALLATPGRLCAPSREFAGPANSRTIPLTFGIGLRGPSGATATVRSLSATSRRRAELVTCNRNKEGSKSVGAALQLRASCGSELPSAAIPSGVQRSSGGALTARGSRCPTSAAPALHFRITALRGSLSYLFAAQGVLVLSAFSGQVGAVGQGVGLGLVSTETSLREEPPPHSMGCAAVFNADTGFIPHLMMLSQPKRHCFSCLQPLQKGNPVDGSWLHAAALALDFGNLLQAFLSYFSSTCYYYRPAKGCFLWCLFHRSWFLVLCRMSSSSPALRSLSEDRTAAVLWGEQQPPVH